MTADNEAATRPAMHVAGSMSTSFAPRRATSMATKVTTTPIAMTLAQPAARDEAIDEHQ